MTIWVVSLETTDDPDTLLKAFKRKAVAELWAKHYNEQHLHEYSSAVVKPVELEE